MKNVKRHKNNNLSTEERRAVKKKWGDLSKRRFFCVESDGFQTPYYFEVPQSVARAGSRYICKYISDFYGAMEFEGIRRIAEVKMIGCMVNWHANILIDTSYINSDSRSVYVMTLTEQKKKEGRISMIERGFLKD